MKFLFRLIVIPVIFLFSLIVFLPKEGFYNLLEKKLVESGITISGEIVKEKNFGIKINSAEVYYDGLNTAFLKKAELNSYLVYTKFKTNNLRISKSLVNILPSKISNINISHSILNPIIIKLDAEGDFGSFEGEANLLNKKFTGELKPSNIMKSKYRNILRNFNLVEGKYLYEYKF